MDNKAQQNSGYVLLLMLLLGTAVMILLAVRTDLFGGGDKGMLEQGVDAVEEANKVKALIESQNRLEVEE